MRFLRRADHPRVSWLMVVGVLAVVVFAAMVLRTRAAVMSCTELADEAERLADAELSWRNSGLDRLAFQAGALAAEFANAQGFTWGMADDADRLAAQTERWRSRYMHWVDEKVQWREQVERRAS